VQTLPKVHVSEDSSEDGTGPEEYRGLREGDVLQAEEEGQVAHLPHNAPHDVGKTHTRRHREEVAPDVVHKPGVQKEQNDRAPVHPLIGVDGIAPVNRVLQEYFLRYVEARHKANVEELKYKAPYLFEPLWVLFIILNTILLSFSLIDCIFNLIMQKRSTNL
jgi:hypothetical protein